MLSRASRILQARSIRFICPEDEGRVRVVDENRRCASCGRCASMFLPKLLLARIVDAWIIASGVPFRTAVTRGLFEKPEIRFVPHLSASEQKKTFYKPIFLDIRNFFLLSPRIEHVSTPSSKKRWFVLPLSAFLVILSFYPFRVPLLVFVAFVPVFYFANFSATLSSRKIFWEGPWEGAHLFLPFLCNNYTISLDPGRYLFTYIVRLLFIPIALIGGAMSGVSYFLTRFLRTSSLISQSFFSMGSFLSLWKLR